MKKFSKILKIVILFFALLIIVLTSKKIVGFSFNDEDTNKKTVVNTEELRFFKNNFPAFSYFEHDSLSNSFSLYDTTNTVFAKALFTNPLCKDIIGYADAIPMVIILNKDEKIEKIFVLDNSETPSYIAKLNSNHFFEKWNGLTINNAVNMQVDAISGATYSSAAIIKSVQKTLQNYSNVQASKKTHNTLNILSLILSFAVLIFAVIQFLINKPNKVIRIILLLACAGIIGFWQGDFLSIYLLNNWFINGFSIVGRLFLFIVVLLALLIPLFTNKNFYCYYLCPFGACQELIGQINPRKLDLGTVVTNALSLMRYIVLFVAFIFIILSIDYVVFLEPFSAFNLSAASLGTIILAIIMLFLSIFINRPWCRFFCPTGALISMLYGPKMKLNLNIKAKNIFPILLGIFVVINIILMILLINSKDEKVEIEKQKVEIMENNALENIFERKSVREYTVQIIQKDTLEKLVKAGMAAPSARNLQVWHFIVLTDKIDLKNLGNKLSNATMLKNAAAAIVVCGNLEKAYCEIDSAYWVQDCSAASENILLAAEALKLGAVWTAVYPYPDRLKTVKDYLKLEPKYIPLNIIVIGHPSKKEKPKNKWNPENIEWR